MKSYIKWQPIKWSVKYFETLGRFQKDSGTVILHENSRCKSYFSWNITFYWCHVNLLSPWILFRLCSKPNHTGCCQLKIFPTCQLTQTHHRPVCPHPPKVPSFSSRHHRQATVLKMSFYVACADGKLFLRPLVPYVSCVFEKRLLILPTNAFLYRRADAYLHRHCLYAHNFLMFVSGTWHWFW